MKRRAQPDSLSARCLRRWKSIATVAAAIVSLGAAWQVLERYQPFAWAGDLVEVAQVSYATAINQRFDMLLILQQHIRAAEARGDHATALSLRQQEVRLQQEIQALQAQQNRMK